MTKEREEEHNNISIEAALKKIYDERNRILEDFAKAYLAETKLLPSQVELVTRQVIKDNVVENIFEFRRKNED